MSGRLPERLTICGMQYRIQEHEGLIVFIESIPMRNSGRRITFEVIEELWYMELSGAVPASHATKAYEQVVKCYGKNFEIAKDAGCDNALKG